MLESAGGGEDAREALAESPGQGEPSCGSAAGQGEAAGVTAGLELTTQVEQRDELRFVSTVSSGPAKGPFATGTHLEEPVDEGADPRQAMGLVRHEPLRVGPYVRGTSSCTIAEVARRNRTGRKLRWR